MLKTTIIPLKNASLKMPLFDLKSPYPPAGDQPQAIESLTKSLKNNNHYQTLVGVTGSGKTYT
ncbi:hypothetical protein I6846_09555, partial [Helicobacter pylori]|nr:hypothetical protein [Helicobacter pylori]